MKNLKKTLTLLLVLCVILALAVDAAPAADAAPANQGTEWLRMATNFANPSLDAHKDYYGW